MSLTYGISFPFISNTTQEPWTSDKPYTSDQPWSSIFTSKEPLTTNGPYTSQWPLTSNPPDTSNEPWSSMVTSKEPLTSNQPFTSINSMFTSNVSNNNNNKSGFSWNGWYVYFVGSLSGLLIIGLVIYCVMKHRMLTKETKIMVKNENYHRLSPEENLNDVTTTDGGADQHECQHQHIITI